MAPSSLDLQRSLDQFAAECEVAGMRISISKSEAMVLSRKPVVVNESSSQVKEFKYLGVLFMSEGMMGRGFDWRVGAAVAVLQALHHTVVMKRELIRKAKFSIYRSIFVLPSPMVMSDGS